MELDPTSWESIEEFKDKLNKLGINFADSGINIDDFCNKLG